MNFVVGGIEEWEEAACSSRTNDIRCNTATRIRQRGVSAAAASKQDNRTQDEKVAGKAAAVVHRARVVRVLEKRSGNVQPHEKYLTAVNEIAVLLKKWNARPGPVPEET